MGKKTLGSPIERHLVKGKRFLGYKKFGICKNTYEEKGNDGIDEDDNCFIFLIFGHYLVFLVYLVCLVYLVYLGRRYSPQEKSV
jgi:hypothetical protein